jgi:hypothetical protein
MKSTYFIEEYKTLVPKKLDEWKIAFPPNVVERLVKEFSQKGDVVFDPFAGFGTTICVANRLRRKGFGTEIDKKKIIFAKEKFKVDLIEKSAFALDYEIYPKIDLCIFSPPYWGPALSVKTYEEYLEKIRKLVRLIKNRMNMGGSLIVLAQNFTSKEGIFTLAWDIGNVIKRELYFERDVIWCVDRRGKKRDMKHEAADHHYCLVFRKRGK